MTTELERLSRAVSHALRHRPESYGIELDVEGWVSIQDLLEGIHKLDPSFMDVKEDDLKRMIHASSKVRHEIEGGRIRALYGHSLDGHITKVEAEPPEHLFHGTSPEAWLEIKTVGLLPMSRQYVHLSVDVATAWQVGRRKSPRPVVLTARAKDSFKSGESFWIGNQTVWLAKHVRPEFLAVVATK